MKWKGSLKAAISGLGLSTGLLVDFQGAGTKVARAIPVIGEILEAAMPLIALGGTLYFGPAVVGKLWQLRPAAKFGKYYKAIASYRDNVGLYIEVMKPGSRAHFTPGSCPKLTGNLAELTEILNRLHIPWPQKSPDVLNDEYIDKWFEYLCHLAPLSLHCDLRSARRLCGELLSKDESDGRWHNGMV